MALTPIPGEERALEVWLCSVDDARQAVYHKATLAKAAEEQRVPKVTFMIPKALTKEINNVLAGQFRIRVGYVFFDTPPKRIFTPLPRELSPALAKEKTPPGYMIIKRPNPKAATRVSVEEPPTVSEEIDIPTAPEGEIMPGTMPEGEIHVAEPNTPPAAIPVQDEPTVRPRPAQQKSFSPPKPAPLKGGVPLDQYKADMDAINARALANARKTAKPTAPVIPGA